MSKILCRILVLVAVLGLAVILTNSLGARVPQARAVFNHSLETGDRTSAPAPSSPLWARSYGRFYGGPSRSLNEDDLVYALVPLDNRDFIVAGFASAASRSSAGYRGAAIMQLDPRGSVKWRFLYPSDPLSQNRGSIMAAVKTGDGGCLALGSFEDVAFDSTYPHIMAINLGPGGRVRWINSYWSGIGNLDEVKAVVRTRDGGYAVAGGGYSLQTDTGGVLVFKLDQAGNVLWSELIVGPFGLQATAIQETPDGGLALAGMFANTTGAGASVSDYCDGQTAWIIRLSSSGSLMWQKSYALSGDACHSATRVNSLIVTRDGGLALAGTLHEPDWYKIWVCKLDDSGTITWQKTLNGQWGASIIQTSDGGYLVTGGVDARAFKLSPGGSVLWAKRYQRSLKTDVLEAAFEKNGGGYVMVSNANPINLAPDFPYRPWIVMSADKNGDIGSGCPFVMSIDGAAQTASVQAYSFSLSIKSWTLNKRTLPYSPHTWPAVRVGHNVCD